MPAAGPAQVAAVEFVRAAVLSAVALLPPAGPALPGIPGRALHRFSVAFAEWAVEFPAAVADLRRLTPSLRLFLRFLGDTRNQP
jgi:hypothetical protein